MELARPEYVDFGLQTIFNAWSGWQWQRSINRRLAWLQELRQHVEAVCREDNARMEQRVAAEEHEESDESKSE